MRPRDWFSAGIRLLGAWLYYVALGDLLRAVSWFLGLIPSSLSTDFGNVGNAMIYNLMYAVGYFALGTYFLFGAERLTRRSFNEPTPDDINDPATE